MRLHNVDVLGWKEPREGDGSGDSGGGVSGGGGGGGDDDDDGSLG